MGVKLSPSLEIGTERGQQVLWLANAEQAFSVGLDISLDVLKRASIVKEDLSYPRDALLVCGDALCLPFRDNSFEFVFCFQTLHHFTYLGTLFDEIKRVLRPGGRFFFSEEGCRDDETVPLWPDPHKVLELDYGIIENAFTKDIWLREISRFDVIFVEYSPPLWQGYRHISALLRKPKT